MARTRRTEGGKNHPSWRQCPGRGAFAKIKTNISQTVGQYPQSRSAVFCTDFAHAPGQNGRERNTESTCVRSCTVLVVDSLVLTGVIQGCSVTLGGPGGVRDPPSPSFRPRGGSGTAPPPPSSRAEKNDYFYKAKIRPKFCFGAFGANVGVYIKGF